MNQEVTASDLKKIIHELMFFIVDAKKYVNKKQREKYTLHYIECFVKTMNLNKPDNPQNLIADIMYKISKDLKKGSKQ